MASNDDRANLQKTDKSSHEIYCDPCRTGELRRQAYHYCKECTEYLCNTCEGFHRKFKMSANNHILSGRTMPKLAQLSQRKTFNGYCNCKQDREVAIFCEYHEDVICDHCSSAKHAECSAYSLQEACSNYTATMLSNITKKVQMLGVEISEVQQDRAADRSKLEELKQKCKDDIKAFRSELNILLNTLEADMLSDLDKRENEQMTNIDQHGSSLAALAQMLESDCELLENAKQNGTQISMYVSDILVSKNLKDYASVLTDIKEDAFTPVLLFTRHKRLADLKTEIMAFGNIKGNYNANSQHADKKVMMGLEIQSTETVDISLPDDMKTPWITGVAFMPAENVILCDHLNDSIKLLDSSWNVKHRLKLSQYPYDVAVVDDSNVVVTQPRAEALQFIEVFPDMKPYRIVSLDKGCYGIDVYNQEIYTTCHNQPGEGEILILDLNGRVKRKIGVNQDGSFLFESPLYISVSKQGNIFVSDLDTNIISCLTLEGCIIRHYEKDDLKKPSRNVR